MLALFISLSKDTKQLLTGPRFIYAVFVSELLFSDPTLAHHSFFDHLQLASTFLLILSDQKNLTIYQQSIT